MFHLSHNTVSHRPDTILLYKLFLNERPAGVWRSRITFLG